MSAIFNVTDLSGGYGDLSVFRDVSLAVGERDVIGILGPNGAGKTTLLRTLCGLLPSHGGDIRLDDQTLNRVKAFRRTRSGLVMVPEGRQIISGLSVLENLELTRASMRAGADNATFDANVAEMWNLFPRLSQRRDQPGDSLSGGEQQMLAIARALMMQPRVLLLDEPTQGLAPIIVGELRAIFQKLTGRFAMVIVEQNREFLTGLATRTAEMRTGQLNFNHGPI